MTWFFLGSALGCATVVTTAAWQRGRMFATFAGVILLLHTLLSTALFPWLARTNAGVVVGLQAVVYGNFLGLVWARPRPFWYRVLVSFPASWFYAGTFLALPWAVFAAFGGRLAALWIPYAIALVGLVQSLWIRPHTVDVVIDRAVAGPLARHPHGTYRSARPLRVVQITDPHLGPFMSEARLRRICERAMAREPDLVLLTGDFLTMESHGESEALGRALAPLRALPGRVFACRGNHDHEAPQTVAEGLAMAGVTLLIDDAAQVATPAGPVHIVAFDYAWRDRPAVMRDLCEQHPRIAGALRLLLLHDPGAFHHLPEGEGDLVLAGHTHGGQLGLVSLGLRWTIVSALTRIPDHGLWARGPDRLYVHRGTGHYGFPLRVGVPGEESLLRVHVVSSTTPALCPKQTES